MALKSELELGKLAIATGVFNETKLHAMLEAGGGLLGDRMVSETLIEADRLEQLVAQLTQRNIYTATWFFGRYLVSEKWVDRDDLKSCMGEIKEGLKAGELKPMTLLETLSERNQLDRELRESLDPQLDNFVLSYTQITSYGMERIPGLDENEQLLRAAYQREMLEDKKLYNALIRCVVQPVEDLRKMMVQAGLITADQAANLSQRPEAPATPRKKRSELGETTRTTRVRRPTRRSTSESTRIRTRRTQTDAGSSTRRPTPEKRGVTAKVGITISVVSVSLIITLGILLSSNTSEDGSPDSADKISLGKSAKAKPVATKQSIAKPPTTPKKKERPAQPRLTNKALIRARTAALRVIKKGQLSDSVDALEEFKETLESNGGGTQWETVEQELTALIRQQGEAIFHPKRQELEQLISEKKLEQADKLLQGLWGALPPGFADDLQKLTQKLQVAMDAAAPKPKPQPKPKPTESTPPKLLTLEQKLQAGVKMFEKEKWLASLQYLSSVCRAQSANFQAQLVMAQDQFHLGNLPEALHWILKCITGFTKYIANGGKLPVTAQSQVHLLLGHIYMGMGETDLALAAFDKANSISQLSGAEVLLKPDLLWRAGRYKEALAGYDAIIKVSGRTHALPHLGRGLCLMDTGQLDQAQSAFDAAAACDDNKGETARTTRVHQAWLQLRGAGANPGFTVNRARQILEKLSPFKTGYEFIVYGMLLVATHAYTEADEIFRNASPVSYNSMADAPFYHGVALLRTGQLFEARLRFGWAQWLRPAISRRLLALPRHHLVSDAVRRDLADLTGSTPQQRWRARRDHRAMRHALRGVDGLARANLFSLAVKDYRAYLPLIEAASLKSEVRRRIQRTEQLAALIERFVVAADKLSKPILQWQGKPAPIKGANTEGVQLSSGARVAWTRISFPDLRALLSQMPLTAKDKFLLGTQAWALGWQSEMHDLLIAARKKHQAAVDAFLAEARWIAPPQGGFVVHDKRLVTASEAKALQKDLTLYNGEWVNAARLKKLQSGSRLVDGQWAQLEDTRLQAQGFTKHQGKWITEHQERQQLGWERAASTLQTTHFEIHSDRGRLFIAKLAMVLEDLYSKLTKVWPKRPDATKPWKILAFSEHRTYLDHLSNGESGEHRIAAGRQTMVLGEPNSLAAYDRTGTLLDFIQVVAGAVTEMYYRQAMGHRPPSWAIAGWKYHFMGFTVLPRQVDWSVFIERPSMLMRRAIRAGTRLTLEQIESFDTTTTQSAHQLEMFEAQAWTLFHFFSTSIDPTMQQQFIEWFIEVMNGTQKTIKQHLGADRWARMRKPYQSFATDL